MDGKCPACGAMLIDGECEYCGFKKAVAKAPDAQYSPVAEMPNVRVYGNVKISPKDWLITLLLAIFLGWLGVHKFYEGKIGMGIVYLLTCGVFCIGWVIDIVKILLNKEKDKNGLIIHRELSQ
ncbi:MAG: TM2 domain-containing protein [Clostridiales bacterium]|nr:TM2 domain-containing protein [Clostridiales bacterium]